MVCQNLAKLMSKLIHVFDTKGKDFSILERIVEKNPPPISGRFRPNLKFVQLQSNRPFTISIHGNKLKDISNSYTKYIEKQFRKELDLKGVPIKIFYKTDDNPFKDKKNKLTERQLKKRARIRRR